MDPSERASLGAYGRTTVQQYYSVKTMADDTLHAYAAASMQPKRLLVSGYYGFHNAGDEAILDALLQSTRALPVPPQITVLSKTPEETAKKHGCNTVPRFNVFRVFRAMRRADLLISGGGSLLQDKSSTRSILYYLSIIRLAKLLKKPVMLYANGIGPVSRPRNRKLVRTVVNRADLVTLREESSREELLRMGVTKPELHVTADPIFLLDTSDTGEAEAALTEANVPTGKPLIGVSVRSLRTGEDFIPQMAALCDRLSHECSAHIVFIPMQAPHDATFSRRIMDAMQSPASLLRADLSPEAFIGTTGRMELVIAMRLHTMLFSAKAGTPVIGLICDPKIEYFAEKLDMPTAGPVETFDADKLFAQTQSVLTNNETHRTKLAKTVAEMNHQATQNGHLLAELLDTL